MWLYTQTYICKFFCYSRKEIGAPEWRSFEQPVLLSLLTTGRAPNLTAKIGNLCVSPFTYIIGFPVQKIPCTYS